MFKKRGVFSGKLENSFQKTGENSFRKNSFRNSEFRKKGFRNFDSGIFAVNHIFAPYKTAGKLAIPVMHLSTVGSGQQCTFAHC